jgi:stearoyl-CoA desaturase (delta-9 desaturase)
MAPNLTAPPAKAVYASDTTSLSSNKLANDMAKSHKAYRREIVWPNVVMHAYLNLAALYGAYLMLTSAKMLTGIWGMYMSFI